MAVLAEFQPTQAPGANARGFLGAYGQMSSLMERKQRLAMDQENQDMERAKFQAFMPAIVAKQKADMISAAASIANATRMENLRAQAAEKSADYNDRFLNIMSIPDDKDRSDTLGAFMGEIAWLDNTALPEYQGFARAVKDERAKSFTQAATNQKLDEVLERNAMLVAGRKEVAEVAAGAKSANAQTYTSSRERIAQLNADTRLSVEDKRAARGAIGLEVMQQRAMEADQMAADAQRDGDTQLAQTFRQNAAAMRDAIEKTTTFAGTGQSAPRTAAQDPKATPKTTFTLPPLTLGGKPLTAGDAAPVREAVQQAVAKPVTGTRAKQGGIWYVFDGSTWNAEKP
jgi:hypothetical protein